MNKNLLIGIHPVEAALQRQPEQLRLLIVAAESKNRRARDLEQRASQLGIRIESRPRATLDRDSDGQRHQDVMAEFVTANLYGEKDL